MVILTFIMLGLNKLSLIWLILIMLSFIMLSFIMLSFIMLSVSMLSVVCFYCYAFIVILGGLHCEFRHAVCPYSYFQYYVDH